MIAFLDHVQAVEEHRVPGMITYPLDEVLLTVLVGLLCRGEDFDEFEFICASEIAWMRKFLPFRDGIAPAQTQRRVLQALQPRQLEDAFARWVASLQGSIRGVVAIDGKTARGSKHDASGADALHVVSAYAHEAGLVLAQRGTTGKGHELAAITDILDLLELSGAIVTIDALGTQKSVADKVIAKGGDYLLALKGNQPELHRDVTEFFADLALGHRCKQHEETVSGHGRIELRTCRVDEAGQWLVTRHSDWKGLRCVAEITAQRTCKKTGKTSQETRFYITSLTPDPAQILAASRAHWSIENNVHWLLDVSLREDHNRTRKDQSARNLAMIRRAVLNLAHADPAKLSIKRKRLKASLNPHYRNKLITVNH
ncbi:MAG: ISAs1-like element ISSod22 family transposase [Alphaproteobacteria bacterium]